MGISRWRQPPEQAAHPKSAPAGAAKLRDRKPDIPAPCSLSFQLRASDILTSCRNSNDQRGNRMNQEVGKLGVRKFSEFPVKPPHFKRRDCRGAEDAEL